MRNIKLLVPLVVLLVSVGFYGCQSGLQHSEKGEAVRQAYFFNIEKLISDSLGEYRGIDGFGTDFDVLPYNSPPAKTTTNVTDNGALLIEPGGWIKIDIPEQFRGGGYLLEFHILYDTNENDDNTEAHFLLEDVDGNMIAQGEIKPNGSDGNIDAHQTFTLQADLTNFSGTASVTLFNTHDSINLEINNYMAILPIETANDANIFIADIRPASSRIDWTGAVWAEPWDTDDLNVSMPDGFWGNDTSCCGGSLQFDLSDVVSSMTQPVLEFNYGRSSADSDMSDVSLYDDDSDEIIYIGSNYAYREDMGQTGIVDLTPWKDSSSFRFNIDNRSWLNPFLKIFDAAASSSAVLLDVSLTGREYVSNSGKFRFFATSDDYPAGGITTDNIEYDAPHWLADPSRAPLGAAGTLVFSIPPAVSSFSHPVMEIMHFAVDSQGITVEGDCGEDCPSYFPIEFYLYDESDNEIAHVFFDEWEDAAGGMLKNQIPLEQFKSSATMKIVVPWAEDRWSQMAFPPFIKIFDSVN